MKKDTILMLAGIAAMMSGDYPAYQKNEVKTVFKPAKPAHRPLRVFTVNGVEVEAYSRKDAITRYKHKVSTAAASSCRPQHGSG